MNLQQLAGAPVTVATITAAIAVSCLRWAGRDLDLFLETGAVRLGEVWRLLLSALPHVGLMHLAFNVYWTWLFGSRLEGAFGSWRTMALFVVVALIANGAEYVLLEGGVGLSGIGYGLFAAIWVLSRLDPRWVGMMDARTVRLFLGWFVLCVVFTYTGIMPVGNVAHGMGAVAGAVCGVALGSKRYRGAALAGLGVLTALVVLGAVWFRSWVNIADYGSYGEALLGYASLDEGRNEDALRWYGEAIRMDPQIGRFWFNRGIAHQRLGEWENAFRDYARAFELDPVAKHRDAYATACATTAKWSLGFGDPAEAARRFRLATQLQPQESGHWSALAEVLTLLGEESEAAAARESAVRARKAVRNLDTGGK